VSADAAADFAAFEDLGFANTLPAAEAALAPVTSEFRFRAMFGSPLFHSLFRDNSCISMYKLFVGSTSLITELTRVFTRLCRPVRTALVNLSPALLKRGISRGQVF
jgi:hypothetical protein